LLSQSRLAGRITRFKKVFLSPPPLTLKRFLGSRDESPRKPREGRTVSTSFVRRHSGKLIAAAAALVALGVFVVVWFQPHKLVIDDRVDEGIPVSNIDEDDDANGATASTEADRPANTGPVTLRAGRFSSLEHDTSGRAKVLRLGDGRRFLRFENLSTSNGPDLRVYLSEVPASDDWYAYGERFVDLGALEGNLGNQNYLIPEDVDLSRYKSAVIWCRRFAVGFGVAPLERGF
jgi:hypothetical protein